MHIGPLVRAMNHNRTRVVLIVLEIAMTLAIVTNCVNLILVERARMSVKSGFDDDNIVRMLVRPFAPEFREASYVDTTIDADLRTIAGVPGVRAATNTHFQLWEGGGSSTGVVALDHREKEPVATQIYFGTKDFIETLGVKIIEGRPFREGDHGVGTEPDPANVAIITKSVADLLFPDGRAVGKTIQQGNQFELIEEPFTIVGVIEYFYNPFGRANDPEVYSDRAMLIPARVGGYSFGIPYLIRTEPGAMNSVIAEVERRLMAANPGRTFEFKTAEEKRSGFFASGKIVVTTMTFIIVALVAVTALGLLGLTSLSVAERTKQIGTRRALGATRLDVLNHFLLENFLVTSVGLLLGIGGAYGLNFFLVTHVSDVKLGWELLAGGIVLLWINGLIATIPPALRAMAVSPAVATRSV